LDGVEREGASRFGNHGRALNFVLVGSRTMQGRRRSTHTGDGGQCGGWAHIA